MAAFERKLGADLKEADFIERGVDALELVVESYAIVLYLKYPFIFVSEEGDDAEFCSRMAYDID